MPAAGRPSGRLGGPEVQQLAGVVPLVERLGRVEAVVALEPDERRAGPGREGPGHLGLAHAGVAFEEQRPLQPQGQEHGGGEPLVAEVALGAEAGDDVVDRGDVADRASSAPPPRRAG